MGLGWLISLNNCGGWEAAKQGIEAKARPFHFIQFFADLRAESQSVIWEGQPVSHHPLPEVVFPSFKDTEKNGSKCEESCKKNTVAFCARSIH